MIKFMQINVDGRRNAHDLMMATASQQGVDVLVISEPHLCGQEYDGWYSDAGNKAAIMAFNTCPRNRPKRQPRIPVG